VVGTEPLFDELPGYGLHSLRPPESGVEVVDHHDVDTAFERPFVGANVRFNRYRTVQRTIGSLDRNVNLREQADRLRLAVFDDLKIFFLQILHEVAVSIGDDRVDFNVVDLQLERWRLRLRLWRRSLIRDERRRRGSHKHNEGRNLETFLHKSLTSDYT